MVKTSGASGVHVRGTWAPSAARSPLARPSGAAGTSVGGGFFLIKRLPQHNYNDKYTGASQVCRDFNAEALSLLLFPIKSERQLRSRMNNVYLLDTPVSFQTSHNTEQVFVLSVKSQLIVEAVTVKVPKDALDKSFSNVSPCVVLLAPITVRLLSQRIDVAGPVRMFLKK